jgi:hypothetical protein
VALDEDGGSLQLCFMLCTRKVDNHVLDLRCNIDAIAMITIFCTVVLSTNPVNGTDTQEFCLLIRQGATKPAHNTTNNFAPNLR